MPKLTYKISLLSLLCCFIFSNSCSENLERKARDAYETYNFGLAWELVSELGDAGRASGFELLALMSVQGLGREADIAGAYSLAEQALAVDSTYSWLRSRNRQSTYG